MAALRLPTYYLCHGGGPWPWMKEQYGSLFDALENSLRAVRRELGEIPKAVLVISAHWEEPVFTVSSSPSPAMLYDYNGFPEYTYHITYPAPGSPELAARVQRVLQAGGIECLSDPQRGFDHATFSLMKPLWPDADIPIVQLSMQQDFDPETHLVVGRLLSSLRDEGVLILGSGASFHNMSMQRSPAAAEPSARFDVWLQQTVVEATPADRSYRLAHWSQAPVARVAHPHEDHFIPLLVAAGAAEDDAAACVYHEIILGWTVSSFRFGPPPN